MPPHAGSHSDNNTPAGLFLDGQHQHSCRADWFMLTMLLGRFCKSENLSRFWPASSYTSSNPANTHSSSSMCVKIEPTKPVEAAECKCTKYHALQCRVQTHNQQWLSNYN